GHDFSVAGYNVSSGSFELSNSGVIASGSLQVPGMAAIHVSGWVKSNRTFSLTSDQDVNLSLGGLHLFSQKGNVTLAGTLGGAVTLQLGGTVNGPAGLSASVSGSVKRDGSFSLIGTGSL